MHLRNGWRVDTLPRPNQLAPKDHHRRARLVATLTTKWEDRWAGRVFTLSKLPAYREESYKGLPPQVAHRQFVIAHLKSRPHSPFLGIGRAVYVERTLPEQMALEVFGPGMLERGKREVEGEEPVPTAEGSFLPSCIMVPGAFGLSCGECTLKDRCQNLSAQLLKEVKARYGSTDPALVRKRAQSRDSSRRHREKKRLATAG
jgi:hypothetical protein